MVSNIIVIVVSKAKRPYKNDQLFHNNRIPGYPQTLGNLFLQIVGRGGDPLLQNSFEMAWNFDTLFYRKEDGYEDGLCIFS